MNKKIKHGVLLAGGDGTRLRPFTYYTSKHLLPVHNKPMIFYPLMNLILLGVENVCLIINPKHESTWNQLLSNLKLPININLVRQEKPEGIPEAFPLCEKLINYSDHYLALGDNILIGSGILDKFKNLGEINPKHSIILGYPVKNPQEFGVAELNKNGEVTSIVEKPLNTKSNLAVVGLYKFTSEVFEFFKRITKSDRGEFEIVDILKLYLEKKKLSILNINNATDYWLDTGNIDSIISATNFLSKLSESKVVDIANIEKLFVNK